MNTKTFLQWLSAAGCFAAAWWLTPPPAGHSVMAAAGGSMPASRAEGKEERPRRLPDSLQQFGDFLAMSDQELAGRYLAQIQGTPNARHAAALLCAVRDESLRRHLLDKSSWGLIAVGREINSLLVEAGLRQPVPPALGISEEEWGSLQQMAQEDCAKAVEAVLSREGLKPGDRFAQLRHLITIAREKNMVRAAVVTNRLPEDITRLLEPEWASAPGSLAVNQESLKEALAVQPSLRPGRIRETVTSKIAEAFLQLDPRGAVKWAISLEKDDFGNAGSSLRGILATARITPGEGARLHAAWPDTPPGNSDDLTVFAGMASARWDWNHFPYDLLDAWTNRAPREAAAWLASIANLTAGGHIAAERIARKLGEQDIAAAAAWVQSLPAGSLRDYAASGLAGAQAERQPADAMRSALGIQESGKRREMISRLAWHGTEGAATAEQRLREAGVSADEIAWVLSNPIRMKP